jgi:predicted TIM-barrel fold metal-dependent hydrolase
MIGDPPRPDVPTADWHAHWLPPALLRLLERRADPPCVRRVAGKPHLWVGRLALRLEPAMSDLSARLEILERRQISWQLLSLSSLWNMDNLEVLESLPLVQAFNDDTARAIRDSSGRLGGLAALPLQDMEGAAAELRRACEAGLCGAILPAAALATLAEARQLSPLLEQANRSCAHLFVHPGHLRPSTGTTANLDNWWARRIVLDTQHQLSAAMLTLASTSLLQDYPNLTVQVANLGGGLPFYLDRLRATAPGNPMNEEDPWSFDLRRIFVDTASFGPHAIELARIALGIDRVVLGTDMPILAGAPATAAGQPPVVSPPITCSTIPVTNEESASDAR